MKRLNQIRENITMLVKMLKIDDKSDTVHTFQMNQNLLKNKETAQHLLDHLIDDNKVKIEMIKESMDLKPYELAKGIWFIFRSIYSPRFYSLIIKKHQQVASNKALFEYLGHREGMIKKSHTVLPENFFARKEEIKKT